jgi:hypothetical protein
VNRTTRAQLTQGTTRRLLFLKRRHEHKDAKLRSSV